MVEKSTKVRRIKATEAEVVKKPKKKAKSSTPKNKVAKEKRVKSFFKKFHAPKWLRVIGKPFAPLGRYIKGSFEELRQTKWPNRKSTWALTLAVLLFSIFFAALILAVDALFDFVIKEVIL